MAYDRGITGAFHVPAVNAHAGRMLSKRLKEEEFTPRPEHIWQLKHCLSVGVFIQNVKKGSGQEDTLSRLGAVSGPIIHDTSNTFSSGDIGFYVGPRTDVDGLIKDMLGGIKNDADVQKVINRITGLNKSIVLPAVAGHGGYSTPTAF